MLDDMMFTSVHVSNHAHKYIFLMCVWFQAVCKVCYEMDRIWNLLTFNMIDLGL